eukprot:TRINITY_DN1916_c0_g1_i21.p1 TRINITY_DN1916_c0_g1~~TRINITY_DN1916_c0_g1_i21.p1  ORF type:complete len:439 (+),score=20.55 TRINITY_DN1916_c0_g1_i21:473-1789(+)
MASIIKLKSKPEPRPVIVDEGSRIEPYPLPARTKGANAYRRKQQLIQLAEENRLLLNKINNQKSHYDFEKIIADRRMHEKILSRMGNYPKNYPAITDGKRDRSQNNKSFAGESELSRSPKNLSTILPKISVSERRSVSAQRPLPYRNGTDDIEPLDSYKVVIKTKTKLLDKDYYLIEMSKDLKNFYIKAFHLKSNSTYSLTMDLEKADIVLQSRKNNYDELLSAVSLVNGELRLIGEKEKVRSKSYSPLDGSTYKRPNRYHRLDTSNEHLVGQSVNMLSVNTVDNTRDEQGSRLSSGIPEEIDHPHLRYQKIIYEDIEKEARGSKDTHPGHDMLSSENDKTAETKGKRPVDEDYQLVKIEESKTSSPIVITVQPETNAEHIGITENRQDHDKVKNNKVLETVESKAIKPTVQSAVKRSPRNEGEDYYTNDFEEDEEDK